MKPIHKSVVLGVLAQALFTASLAVAADINERTIKLGYGTPAEHPIGQGVNTFAEARAYQRKVNRDQSAALLADLKAKGMVVNEVAPEESFEDAAEADAGRREYTKEIGEDLVKQAQAEIDRAKQQN